MRTKGTEVLGVTRCKRPKGGYKKKKSLEGSKEETWGCEESSGLESGCEICGKARWKGRGSDKKLITVQKSM